MLVGWLQRLMVFAITEMQHENKLKRVEGELNSLIEVCEAWPITFRVELHF